MASVVDEAKSAIRSRLSEVKEERRRLEGALAALEGIGSRSANGGARKRATARRSTSRATSRAPRGQRQQQLLRAIRRHPGERPSQLAKRLGVAPQQIHAIARRLAADGKVAKRNGGYVAAEAKRAGAKAAGRKRPAAKRAGAKS